MVAARLLFRSRFVYSDGAIREIVIWQVPKDRDRPHGLKYRCHYQHTDDKQWVRYDNERGKGNHRHINTREAPYDFQDFRQLIMDFLKDIQAMRGEL
jgi:hypothetical protein